MVWTTARCTRRRDMLAAVDAHFRTLEKSDALDSMDAFYQHAYKLISSQQAREAFNLKAETGRDERPLRAQRGRHEDADGATLGRDRACVLFRSPTAVGITMATSKSGIESQTPNLDQGVAALLDDLQERGMLDRTLVLLTTEFGRTPKINPQGGRDHWPRVFSIMMAGGGIRRGMVHGASDALGGEPADNPVQRGGFRRHRVPPDRHRSRQTHHVTRRAPGGLGERRPYAGIDPRLIPPPCPNFPADPTRPGGCLAFFRAMLLAVRFAWFCREWRPRRARWAKSCLSG